MDVVFNYIKSNPDQFDGRVYTEGFSQNSGMAAYVGYCFSDYVRGVWQAGAGSKPVEPCFTKKRPMIECIPDYTNDYRTHDPFCNGDKGSKIPCKSENLYKVISDEGHDTRRLVFTPDEQGGIPGGHVSGGKESKPGAGYPRNQVLWQLGCWGVTPPCSQACEEAVIECVNETPEDISTASDRAIKFGECMENRPKACSVDCSPTLNMLKESENPEEINLSRGTFGAVDESIPHEEPSTSVCVA